jgi:sporulation protein YlmC with PRC-barrel domain
MTRTLLSGAAAMALLLGTASAFAETQRDPAGTDTGAAVGDQTPGVGGMTQNGRDSGETPIVGTGMGGQDYRAFSALDDQDNVMFGAGFEKDDLEGATVVGQDGEEIGEVTELLASEDGSRVDAVLIERAGGDKIAVQLIDLQRAEGAEGELVLARSAAELDQMPRYEEREDGHWSPAAQ